MIPIAARLKRFLSSHRVDYRLYCHPRTYDLKDCAKKHGISEQAFAKAIVLKDSKHYFVAVLPLRCDIDFTRLNRLLKRDVYKVSDTEADRLFTDCEPLSHPPVATPYALPVIIDSQLLSNKEIYFEAGSHAAVIKLDRSDFCYVMADATWGRFGQSGRDSQEGCQNQQKYSKRDLDKPQSDQETVLPTVVRKIVSLSENIVSSPDELVSLFKQDLHIALTLQSYQQAHQEKNDADLDPTLKRLLSFDSVSHTTLDCAHLQMSQMAQGGPLGLDRLWRHAKCCAHLCHQLAQQEPYFANIDPQTAYLGGLLHNLGLIFIGHMYAPEYKLLNRWFTLQPNAQIKSLESRLLGLGNAQRLLASGHDRIGFWILHHWGVPLPVQKMAKHHHNIHYSGCYLPYVRLVMLVNKLLRDNHLGEGQLVSSQWVEAIPDVSTLLDKCQIYYQDWLKLEAAQTELSIASTNKVS